MRKSDGRQTVSALKFQRVAGCHNPSKLGLAKYGDRQRDLLGLLGIQPLTILGQVYLALKLSLEWRICLPGCSAAQWLRSLIWSQAASFSPDSAIWGSPDFAIHNLGGIS